MIRLAFELTLLFLIPTVAYLGYALLMRPGRPAGEVVGEAPLILLGFSGAALVLGTLIYYGVTTETTNSGPDQTYTPPRIKDGRIEPGHFE